MRRSHKHAPDPSLAALQSALTAAASADELTGEADALGAYRAVSWREGRSLRRPAIFATKLGAATVAALLGLSGVATAAYTGSLPPALQDVAHKTIKAPKAHKDHPPTQAVGPDAAGSAAWGLCQAFAKDKAKDEERADKEPKEPKATHEPQGRGKGLEKKQEHAGQPGEVGKDRGQSKEKSVAYRNLVRAAGGEDKVEAYCASVPKPSGEPEGEEGGKPTKEPKATGKPSAKPQSTGKPTDLPAPAQSHPTGSPSPLPTGSPTDLPTS